MESIGLESPDDHNLSQIWSTCDRSSRSVRINLLIADYICTFSTRKFVKSERLATVLMEGEESVCK